jgi:hypothetical protein
MSEQNWQGWAEQVASAGGWTLEPSDTPDGWYRRATLPTGERFGLGHNNGKVHFSGNYPMFNGRSMSARDWFAVDYKESPPECSVSATREPVAAAKDIERRFLVPFRAVYAKCLATKAEREAFGVARANGAEQLLAALQGTGRLVRDPDPMDPAIDLHGEDLWGTIRAGRLELRSCPDALLLILARAIGDFEAEETEASVAYHTENGIERDGAE